MLLGELLKLGREIKGWSLRDLERECGISNAMLSQIESGHVKNPSFTSVVRVCEALNVPLGRAAELVSLSRLKGILRDQKSAPPDDRKTETEWRIIDDLRKHWHAFCDADQFDGSDTFTERMEAAGFIELVPVDDDALEESFAAERGIERGGMMWALTLPGRAALAQSEEKK